MGRKDVDLDQFTLKGWAKTYHAASRFPLIAISSDRGRWLEKSAFFTRRIGP